MDVVAVPEGVTPPVEDYFRQQGWPVARNPGPGQVPVMVRQRFDAATLGACLSMPWGGGIEMADSDAGPIGPVFRRHLAEGGLALALRSDTAYGIEVARLFAAALHERLIEADADIADLEFAVHELLANAMLHGNFGIGSGLMDRDLDAFGDLVERALATPKVAARRVQLSASLLNGRLEVAVEDDGAGYESEEGGTLPEGRPHGLSLVGKMAAELRIEAGGRRTVAVFPFRPRRHLRAAPGLGSAHVLVVDDNPLNRAVVEALLKGMGVGSVEGAGDGIDGLAAVERRKPDLILLDVMMPRMDGFEMCRQLRRIHPLTTLPVIFVTALGSAEDRAACFAAGATDMVSKPIDTTEVAARVGVHLRLGLVMERLRSFQDRIHDELQAARSAQLALTPTPQQIERVRGKTGLVVEGVVETSSELGGDFWTLIEAGPRQLGLIVADFSGHGPVAAFNVFRLHLLLSRLPRKMPPPGDLLDHLNRELRAVLKPGEFAAVFVGSIDLDAGTLTFAAGAMPPPLLAVGDEIHYLDVAGPPLGAFEDPAYEERVVELPAGARLLVYSDALMESESDGRAVCDEATLLEWVSAAPTGQCLAAEVFARFRERLPGSPPDDLTLVCVRRPD